MIGNNHNIPPGVSERDLTGFLDVDEDGTAPITTPYDDDMDEFNERQDFAAAWFGR